MYCISCGSPNPEEAEHCAACGAALMVSAPADPAAVADQIPPTADYPPAAAADYQPPSAPEYVPATPSEAAAAAMPSLAAPAARGSESDRNVAGYRVSALGDRLIAMILDTFLLVGIFAVVGSAAGARWGGITPTGFDLTGTGALATIGIILVVGFVYFWLCEGLLGLTLGKAIAGVRIINASGRPCGLGPSLIRNILRIIDGMLGYLVGYFIAIFSRLRQRLGDHLANTYAIEQEPRALYRVLWVVLWVVLVAGSFFGAYYIHKG